MSAPAARLGRLAPGRRKALQAPHLVADPLGDDPLERERWAGAIALLAAGAVSTAATVAVVASSDVLAHQHRNAALRGLAVALFVAVGASTWWRRPESRLGLLVAGIGLSFSLTSLMAFAGSLPFTLGRVALAVFVVFTVYVFVCFPRDHVDRGVESWFMRALVTASTVLWALALAVTVELPVGGPVAQCADRCPGNALRFVSAPTAVSDVLTVAVNALTTLALAGVTLMLLAKARSPDRLRRRVVAPLLWAMSALLLAYAAYITLRQAGVAGAEVPGAFAVVAFLALPVGMLFGQIRGRIFAATRLGRLVAAAGDTPVTPERMQSLIADTLGDPTLELVLWSPEHMGYVDVSGAPVHLPSQGGDRTAVPVTRDGRRVAAVVHDRALDQGQGMTEGVAATALVLLDNARLVEELSASRTRIAETAQRERARLERDLHDGAQQRLVAIQIKLSLLRELEDPGERDVLFDEVEGDATAAVEELHDLAHGIFPSLLGDRGLAAALRSVARSAPMPVSVRSRGTSRYAPATEAAVYFSVLEALQNALKHAGSTAHVELSLDCFDGAVTFAVADRGNGFDVGLQSAGLGLVSMRDRMAAVGGTLVVSSTPGGGTTVSGRAPARRENQEAL